MAPFCGPNHEQVLKMLKGLFAKRKLPIVLGYGEPQAVIVRWRVNLMHFWGEAFGMMLLSSLLHGKKELEQFPGLEPEQLLSSCVDFFTSALSTKKEETS